MGSLHTLCRTASTSYRDHLDTPKAGASFHLKADHIVVGSNPQRSSLSGTGRGKETVKTKEVVAGIQ
jgi:hypothetical protein